MFKTYLFVRKTGILGTKIVETTRKEAVKYIRENNKINDEEIQIGILGGKDYETVKSVYGEYAPFKKLNSISEL